MNVKTVSNSFVNLILFREFALKQNVKAYKKLSRIVQLFEGNSVMQCKCCNKTYIVLIYVHLKNKNSSKVLKISYFHISEIISVVITPK